MEDGRSRFHLYRVRSKMQAVKPNGSGIEEIVTIYPGTIVLTTGASANRGWSICWRTANSCRC